MQKKKQKGITLIVLVITIIILLILAGVTIMLLTGENGILNKSTIAANETNKQTATEIMNLKITNVQIENYAKNQEVPTLQILADALCEDGEIEYVKLKEKKIASLEPIKILSGEDTILTKLIEYPYQFEIDGNLRLASIDGIKIADSSDSKLAEKLEKLETTVSNLQTEHLKSIESLQTENQELKNRVEILENETIVNKRIKLTSDNFTPLEIALPTSQINKYYGSILLKESIEQYKYLEIQIEIKDNDLAYWGNKTVLIALDSLKYNNSNTIRYDKDTVFTLISDWGMGAATGLQCYLKNEKEIVIGSAATLNERNGTLRIKDVHGLK